jgi:hypothetical protein
MPLQPASDIDIAPSIEVVPDRVADSRSRLSGTTLA